MATITNPALPPASARAGGSNDRSGADFGGGDERLVASQMGRTSRTGIWLAFCTISMTFAAFTSAMIVRKGSTDWGHLDLPWMLYANTFVLLTSSATLEVARRRTAVYMRSAGASNTKPMRWLAVTLGLGLLFVAGQLLVWRRLAQSGLYIATNPNSSFLYLFTAAHAIHVLGGLTALLVVMYRLLGPVPSLRKSTIAATSYYWHFMGLLWIYLLLLLRTQL